MSRANPWPFDSHRFVMHMTEAGMPLSQAEALAGEQGVIVTSHLATRQDTDELKQDTGELKDRFTNVERDIGVLKEDNGELKHRLTNVERDVGELKTGIAVVRAELAMVKWMISGVGAGMLVLVVQSFWPI